MTRVLILIFLVVGQIISYAPNVWASDETEADSGVVIAQVYPGATGSASHEFIELYNNSNQDVDITGWCVYKYADKKESSRKATIGCLDAPDGEEDVRLFLPSHGYATFISEDFLPPSESMNVDGVFTARISSDKGYIVIVPSAESEEPIDSLGWGELSDTAYPAFSKSIENGKSLERKANEFKYMDTGIDGDDFIEVDPIIHPSMVYEQRAVVDACPNLDYTEEIPEGYLKDENGDCQPDSCLNIKDLQVSVPDGYDSDEDGKCTVVPLVLNELLANVSGSDTGNEFIEIYNPTEQTIDLSLYGIKIGDSDKVYTFPAGETIQPGEYRAFSDTSMKFTLVNSSSRVVLSSVDKTSVFGDSGWYDSPAEDESWALLDGTWQYTNRPTPGAINMPSIILEITEKSELAPCPAGKYRNPLTNRCRNIVSDASVLAACKDGQYRNPETNRCRKIETSNLKPCKDGQYRSEETNRCRNILGASTLKPCKENQYRSEETNRCRNLPGTSSVPEAAFAVKPIADKGTVFIGWWALGGVVSLALGYAVWEWREEIIAFWRRLLKRP